MKIGKVWHSSPCVQGKEESLRSIEIIDTINWSVTEYKEGFIEPRAFFGMVTVGGNFQRVLAIGVFHLHFFLLFTT